MTRDRRLSIAAAADFLGISKRHVKRIPPALRHGRAGPRVYYLRSEIEDWRDRELASPCGVLQDLREKWKNIRLKKLKRSMPHTKTGKVKKRFRDPHKQPPHQNCPNCGSPLISEVVEYREEPYDDDDSERARAWQSAAERGNRVRKVTVEFKGRKGISYHIEPNVDQAIKNAEAAAQVRPEPKLVRYEIRSCLKCGYREELPELEALTALYDQFDHDNCDVDQRSIQSAVSEIGGGLPEKQGDE